MPSPYQYGTLINGVIIRYGRKQDAVEAARSWVTSPLRTGPRLANLVRRRGWYGEWKTIDTWSLGFGQKEA